jgi:ribosomal protein S18 acetylase RimI-like enzyme
MRKRATYCIGEQGPYPQGPGRCTFPDVEVQSLGYRTDLMVRRLAGASIVDRGPFIVVRTPDNPSFHWGNFLLWPGPPGADELTEWIAAFTAEFPDAAHMTFGVDGTVIPEQHTFPSSMGLKPDLAVVLTAERPPPVADPGGSTILRPLRSDEDWRQDLLLLLALDAEEAPLHPGHDEYLERRTDEARTMVGRKQAEYFGAFADDRLCSVVGIASDGQGVARYQSVGTLSDYRRRGFASALLARAGSFAVDEWGARLLVIVADRDGPAAALYRSVGFDPTEEQWGMSVSVRS